MNINELREEWEVDSKLDRKQLGNERIRISELKTKWIIRASRIRTVIHKQESILKDVIAEARIYLSGKQNADPDYLAALKLKGKEPFEFKLLREDYDNYLNKDPDVKEARRQLFDAQNALDFVKDVLDQTKDYGFAIRDKIEWTKFMRGVDEED